MLKAEEEEDSTAVVLPKKSEESEEAEEQKKPDALIQLIQCFQRAATSEQKSKIALTDDKLYIEFSDVMAKVSTTTLRSLISR